MCKMAKFDHVEDEESQHFREDKIIYIFSRKAKQQNNFKMSWIIRNLEENNQILGKCTEPNLLHGHGSYKPGSRNMTKESTAQKDST